MLGQLETIVSHATPPLVTVQVTTFAAATVMFPVQYVPALTAVWAEVDGVIVVAPLVVSCFVLDAALTVIVPAVPDETQPADTVGVTLCVFAELLAVINPEELTLMPILFGVIVVAGVVAEPDFT